MEQDVICEFVSEHYCNLAETLFIRVNQSDRWGSQSVPQVYICRSRYTIYRINVAMFLSWGKEEDLKRSDFFGSVHPVQLIHFNAWVQSGLPRSWQVAYEDKSLSIEKYRWREVYFRGRQVGCHAL